MDAQKPSMKNEEGVWVVRVPRPNGTMQEFRCATERQARHLVSVLSSAEPTQPHN